MLMYWVEQLRPIVGLGAALVVLGAILLTREHWPFRKKR